MAVQLVPYNNSMRLRQGFNSFTQAVTIDNAAIGITDSEDSQPLQPRKGTFAPIAGDDTTDAIVLAADKKSLGDIIGGGADITKYPSQIATYSSKYVSKLSDVSNDLNVSGSLSIRYGEISGGSGSFVNTETFNQTDINFLITVKVINQTINVKDQLQFWPLQGKAASAYSPVDFTNVIKALDSSNLTNIKASAHIALQVGVGSVEATGDFSKEKSELNQDSEVNITVNWSGGGQLKENEKPWTIETLQEVAAKFPDLVSRCPQRTHAVLTKYTALRGYLQWRENNSLEPLDYEVANLSTSELLDVYMGYKTIWKQIHDLLDELDGEDAQPLIKSPNPTTVVSMPQVNDQGSWVDGAALHSFEPSFVVLDLALRTARSLMVLIADENNRITKDPSLAVHPTRPVAYLRPQVFKQLLPVYASTGPLSVVLCNYDVHFESFRDWSSSNPWPTFTVTPTMLCTYNMMNLRRSGLRQVTRLSAEFPT